MTAAELHPHHLIGPDGCDVNAADGDGMTLLMMAVLKADVVKILLGHPEIEVNADYGGGWTAELPQRDTPSERVDPEAVPSLHNSANNYCDILFLIALSITNDFAVHVRSRI